MIQVHIHFILHEAQPSVVLSILVYQAWGACFNPYNALLTQHTCYSQSKVNQVAYGSVEKHKARFVAYGLSQVEGSDYNETFTPVARYSSIKSILSLSAQMGWKIHQMYVKTTFLNSMI